MDEELKKAAYLGLNLVVLRPDSPGVRHHAGSYHNDVHVSIHESQDVLTEILREGAQAMLTTAIEAEVAEWIEGHEHLQDERGHRQVVRNGYLPERSITTGIGPVKIRQRLLFLKNKGFEYNLALIGLLLPILIAGPGRFAIGRFLPLQKTRKSGRPIVFVE